jgi:protoporphyrinogen IX oxidase
MNDSRKVVIPCFSSLSRCLSVLTAIRLAGPGFVPGPFYVPSIIRAMGSGYLWVKAFHIVFVASWFAGLFYLPRLFVNLAMVPAESHAERARLLLMARKLYRFSGLLMLPALVLGLVLWLAYGVGRGSGNGWMHAKLALVLAVLAYHHVCGRLLRRFEQGANRRSERWYRVFNETSVLLFAAIVVLVVVKPF